MGRATTISFAFLSFYASLACANPFLPGRPQDHPIALVGGTVHPVEGDAIEGGTVLFENGKITAIGKDIKLPAKTEIIHVKGKHVYPGLFDAYTHLGLAEIEAVRATLDQVETGKVNPNAKALIAVNPDSELIPVTRSNGVLTVLTAPMGGLISGTSAVIHLDGWTWEDMAMQRESAMHVNWPREIVVRPAWSRKQIQARVDRREKELQAIKEAFADARAYLTAKKANGKTGQPTRTDARWEAMIPALERRVPVIVHADEQGQIQAAVAFSAKENLRLILAGGLDAPSCIELLKKHNIPVVLLGVHRLPLRADDDYDTTFTLAKKLHEAGLKFCISGAEMLGNERNLPYHAATCAAHGLPAAEALKAITLYPAQLLGLGDQTGSLKAGKDATLIVADGDILEITSHVEQAFIQGRRVDLSDRHKLLWQKYREKYRQAQKKEPK
jgi:imidazolonepropionase-like amidohydrolase